MAKKYIVASRRMVDRRLGIPGYLLQVDPPVVMKAEQSAKASVNTP